MQAITQDTLMNNVLQSRAKRIAATPNSEEKVNPFAKGKNAPVDVVKISETAKEIQQLKEKYKDAPRIDWENRIMDGKKIPDNIYEKPTPEMLSGEQPYSVLSRWATGEVFYMKQPYNEKETAIRHDLQLLSGMQQHVENMLDMQQEYRLRTQGAGRNSDPIATSTMVEHTVQASGVTQKLLEEMVLGYQRSGIDLLEAHNTMSEISLGEFSLADMIQRYFGVDIRK